MLRIIVDTNILISGIISPFGSPRKIYEAWRNEQFNLLTSPSIQAEVKEVLQRPKIADRYHLSSKDIQNTLLALELFTQNEDDGIENDISFSDKKDRKFLALARFCQADYIVSGDKKLLALGEFYSTKIVTAQKLLQILSEK